MNFYKIFMIKEEGSVVLKNHNGQIVEMFNKERPFVVYNEMIVNTLRENLNTLQQMGVLGFSQMPENFLNPDPEFQKEVFDKEPEQEEVVKTEAVNKSTVTVIDPDKFDSEFPKVASIETEKAPKNASPAHVTYGNDTLVVRKSRRQSL